jgi:hypothetical protein
MTRIRIKVLLLIVFSVSAVGLNRATAESCAAESCARVVERERAAGYGCVLEGTVAQRCTATLNGCVYESCGLSH